VQRDVHDVFISVVKERRGPKLRGPDSELFSGAFWSAKAALEYGLIDGITDLRTKMRALHGDEVRLRVVPLQTGGWLARRLRRLPSLGGFDAGSVASNWSLGDDIVSAVETRSLWSRFGL
jgi:ClpP class serine protease